MGDLSEFDEPSEMLSKFHGLYVAVMGINFFAMIISLSLFLPAMHPERPRVFITLPVVAVSVMSIFICLYHTTTILSHPFFWFSLVVCPSLVIGPILVRVYMIWHLEKARPVVPSTAPALPYRGIYVGFAIFIAIHILVGLIAVAANKMAEETTTYYYIFFVLIVMYAMGAIAGLYILSRMPRRGTVRAELIVLLLGAITFIVPVIVIDLKPELYERVQEWVPADIFFFFYTWIIYISALLPVMRDTHLPRHVMQRFHRLSMCCCRRQYTRVDQEFERPTVPGLTTLGADIARKIHSNAQDTILADNGELQHKRYSVPIMDGMMHLLMFPLFYEGRDLYRVASQCGLHHHLDCMFLLQELKARANRRDATVFSHWRRLHERYFSINGSLRRSVSYELYVQPIEKISGDDYQAFSDAVEALTLHMEFILTPNLCAEFVRSIKERGYLFPINDVRFKEAIVANGVECM